MVGVEVALGTQVIDTLASLIVAGIVKHKPDKQIKTGNLYIERGLGLVEEYGDILMPQDMADIQTQMEHAGELKKIVESELETCGRFKAMVITHNFKNQSKKFYVTTKDRSTQARMRRAFPSRVADAVAHIAERESDPAAFDEGAREGLRLRVINSIESSPEVRSDSHENATSAEVVELAKKVWSMVNIRNAVIVINSSNVENTVNVENAGPSNVAVNINNSVRVENSANVVNSVCVRAV